MAQKPSDRHPPANPSNGQTGIFHASFSGVQLHSLFNQYNKLLFAGVGNVLRHDDGIGVYISGKIRNTDNVASCIVGQSIENYIGKINKTKSDVLVVIDCVDLNEKPGQASLLPIDKIKDYTFNTHNISLNRVSDFFQMPVFVLGIQPLDISFGEGFSEPVLQTANTIIEIINQKENEN